MRAVVCDCSVSAPWCLRDETNDAAYLELAIRAGTPLATLDRRLTAAARDARVDLVSETASP